MPRQLLFENDPAIIEQELAIIRLQREIERARLELEEALSSPAYRRLINYLEERYCEYSQPIRQWEGDNAQT